MKGIEVGAINVVLQPHSPEIYENWVRTIFRLRLKAAVHGNRFGALSQLYRTGADEGVTLQGVVSTFVHFDKDLPWYNDETSKDATPQDLGKVSLPEHLRPDHKRCNFAFDTKRHLFLFEADARRGGLTPRLMLRLLERFAKEPRIAAKFGLAKLTVVPDTRAVEEILEWGSLKKLVIATSLPNPDFADAAFSDLEDWMSAQGAETFRQELGSSQPDLVPDEETKNLARIASEHGYIEATGIGENNRVVRLSTRSAKPLTYKGEFDPEVEAEVSAFVRLADFVARGIARRRSALKRIR
ncbi:DUF4747 family protein [Xanthomonas arboricola]|uniref:DUF4747 family protein n=1 Tax=Xanthomonas arboricola TaxID=56448 RepID=UPI001AFB6EC5|nr:DUF4747 family protein [Xanthomonas arboricola]CAD7377128.1 DUF4747 family protein [Xanthomonas arboricola]CAG2084812.1 DUF4747 family protein [Xanthomonas arboricola pv. juglandis]